MWLLWLLKYNAEIIDKKSICGRDCFQRALSSIDNVPLCVLNDWNDYNIQKGVEISFMGKSYNPSSYLGYRIIITPQPT